MSRHAKREQALDRHLCICGKRALYVRAHGRGVAFRRDHPLCQRCWGSLMDRVARTWLGSTSIA
jgi:hypothetical protein